MVKSLLAGLAVLLLASCGASVNGAAVLSVTPDATPASIEAGHCVRLHAVVASTSIAPVAYEWSILEGGGSIDDHSRPEDRSVRLYCALPQVSGDPLTVRIGVAVPGKPMLSAQVTVLVNPAVAPSSSASAVKPAG